MFKKVMVAVLFLVAFAALAAGPAPARAGGWATAGVTEMPEEIHAGEQFTLEFMVWQHGNKPVHELTFDPQRPVYVEPQVIFTPADGGAPLTFLARPLQQKGLFGVDITLPVAGAWTWEIRPEPLAGVSEFAPLTVLPPLPAAAGSGALGTVPALLNPGLPLWGVVGLVALLVVALSVAAVRVRH